VSGTDQAEPSLDTTLRAVDLRCNHLPEPLGVPPERVRLSWRVEGGGQAQSAYRTVVAPSAHALERLEDLAWDSGQVKSSASTDVAYEGAALGHRSRYAWRAQVWDQDGRASPWSKTAWFETELDPERGWHGTWIGGPLEQVSVPYLRRSFWLDEGGVGPGEAASARLYVTALGLYEARLNGQRVGEAALTPGWTDYNRRVQYQTYDVTDMLVPGENVLAVVLADGWCCGFFGFQAGHARSHYGQAPLGLVELVIQRKDAAELVIPSDSRWRAGTGAVKSADLLMGERVDLAAEPVGWDRPGFDASHWGHVSCVERDGRLIVADPGPPVRVTEDVVARDVSHERGGCHIVDFGQNLAGWVRLKLPPGNPGHVTVRHGEMLTCDGSLYTDNLRSARQTDEVAFAASESEAFFEPRFTFHGFRYAEVSGYPGELSRDDIVARAVHSDIARAGSFECSSAAINRLYANIDWGQRSNFIGIPTDCPQRDERLGWLGDAQIFARTACYNRDVQAFFHKWLDDVRDAQLPSGAFSDVAPRLGLEWGGAPAWGDAGVIVPWTIYKMYADVGVLERNFEAMQAWMAYIARDNRDHLRTKGLGNNYGDWLAPNGDFTPRELLASAYWAYDAAIMAEVAQAVGDPQAAMGYRDLLDKVRAAFAAAFVEHDGRVSSGTQTAYVLALHMNLVPPDLHQAAASYLVEAIAREDWHLSTGFVGVGYLLPVLSSQGYSAVAYRLLEQHSFPSWLYSVDRGATTIWERWDGWTEHNGFQSAEMNSFNHYSLGSVGEWLYRFVLGFEQAPGSVGFSRVALRPHMGGSLSYASGSYRSVRGTISSSWERSGGTFSLRVEIPPSVTASVRTASSDPAAVREAAGQPPSSVAEFPGSLGAREAVFEVGPGSYTFSGPALEPLS